MDGELTFGADCVIRLEDLGEFKDYSDTLEVLKTSLQSIQSGHCTQIPSDLWQVIDSDPEDTFFLPDFQNILGTIASINWTPLVTQEQNYKIFAFYFRVIEQAFISFTFGEEVVDVLITQILGSKKLGMKIQRLIMRLIFNLCDKVMYIEDFNKLALLWNIFNQDEFFKSFEEKNRDVAAAVYAQCCEKYLRNRQLRKLITQDEIKPFILLKLAVWERNKDKFSSNLERLEVNHFHNSNFLKETCLFLQVTFNKL